MRTKAQIALDIEVLKQEIRYARADEDEASVEDLYADLDELYEELYSAQSV